MNKEEILKAMENDGVILEKLNFVHESLIENAIHNTVKLELGWLIDYDQTRDKKINLQGHITRLRELLKNTLPDLDTNKDGGVKK